MLRLKSVLADIVWPAVPAANDSRVLSVLFQLEQSQWWPWRVLREHQFKQVSRVLLHAYLTVPLYQRRIAEAGLNAETFSLSDDWQKIPILSRRDVQTAGDGIHSTKLGKEHGKIGRTVTSGSTGQPVTALSTEVTRIFWRVFTLRDHFWHRRDFSQSLAAIRDTHATDAQLRGGG